MGQDARARIETKVQFLLHPIAKNYRKPVNHPTNSPPQPNTPHSFLPVHHPKKVGKQVNCFEMRKGRKQAAGWPPDRKSVV